jgi:hypothetical protein
VGIQSIFVSLPFFLYAKASLPFLFRFVIRNLILVAAEAAVKIQHLVYWFDVRMEQLNKCAMEHLAILALQMKKGQIQMKKGQTFVQMGVVVAET